MTVKNLILSKAGGNPLFVEEVIKSLAIDGQIILREGHWQQRDTDRLQVPSSIKSVLGGRLKRIKKSTFELLQLAATIGRNFTLELLSEASPYSVSAARAWGGVQTSPHVWPPVQ